MTKLISARGFARYVANDTSCQWATLTFNASDSVVYCDGTPVAHLTAERFAPGGVACVFANLAEVSKLSPKCCDDVLSFSRCWHEQNSASVYTPIADKLAENAEEEE